MCVCVLFCFNRCLPLNFRKDEIRGIYKDRMKIGANLADVDPMQLDSSVSILKFMLDSCHFVHFTFKLKKNKSYIHFKNKNLRGVGEMAQPLEHVLLLQRT